MRVHRFGSAQRSAQLPAQRMVTRATLHSSAKRCQSACMKAQANIFEAVSSTERADTTSAALRIPPVMMALGGSSQGGGGGATLERSKLSFKQKLQQTGPQVADAGGGGGIGNKVVNGGDGGGGDEDDDDYFDEGDGEDDDGDESRWWHRVPLKQMYDAATVKAVLSEWCLTVERLPGFLQMLTSMQYYSTAQWVRYLTIQERPNVFRAVERSLARFPDARSGFVGRMLADPAFMQKTALEGGIAFGIALAHEVHVRGKRMGQEIDFALTNALCIGLAAATCSALVAPSKTPTAPTTKFPWQGMLSRLPNNAFEKNTPARTFEIPQRVSGLVAKGVELSAVNAIAGGASAAIQSCLVAARQAKNPRYKPVTPVPGISRAAGGMGVYGGLASNARLQAASGLDRVLLEYAKANTTWQVIGVSSAFRALSQLVVENPWGVGPAAVKSSSRPALQGMPVDHVATPAKRRRKRVVKKTRVARPPAPEEQSGGAAVGDALPAPVPA